jgi:hypothetical protein
VRPPLAGSSEPSEDGGAAAPSRASAPAADPLAAEVATTPGALRGAAGVPFLAASAISFAASSLVCSSTSPSSFRGDLGPLPAGLRPASAGSDALKDASRREELAKLREWSWEGVEDEENDPDANGDGDVGDRLGRAASALNDLVGTTRRPTELVLAMRRLAAECDSGRIQDESERESCLTIVGRGVGGRGAGRGGTRG